MSSQPRCIRTLSSRIHDISARCVAFLHGRLEGFEIKQALNTLFPVLFRHPHGHHTDIADFSGIPEEFREPHRPEGCR